MIHISCDLHGRVVNIKGHAGFDEYGKDIVCAAVSGITQYFARIVLRYGGRAIKDEGYLEIVYPEELDAVADELGDVLEEIAGRYPRNVKVEVKRR